MNIFSDLSYISIKRVLHSKPAICTLTIYILIALILASCSEQAKLRRRVKNTIAACGYIADAGKMHDAMKSELAIYDLKPREVIGEIGFGTGWFTGFMLMHYDSLTYYANDIDAGALLAIDPVTKKYLGLRKTSNTNTLIVTTGTPTKTKLPANSFDKIIVRETFHHFDHPNEMLQDIKSLLKPGGKVFVYEPDIGKTFFSRDCGSYNYSKTDLLKFFTGNSFTVAEECKLFDTPGNIPSWVAKDKSKLKPKTVFVLISEAGPG